MLSSFTSKPLRFVPHALVGLLLRLWGRFFSKPRWPKAPKPEPQISGKASASGMYPRSITDMCCCQLASTVAHLLPALTSSCLCFVAPKQGPDSGPKNGATILKLAAQLPNVWSQFWAHGVCVLPSAKSALSCDRLHLPFMFSCAWCQDAGFTVYIYMCVCYYIVCIYIY